MNVKQRIQKFWKYFEIVQKDLEISLQTADMHETAHILEDVNQQLQHICGCKMEVEISETEFYEMTFATGGDKTAQLCAALLKKDAPKQMMENWIINAFRQPLSARAMNSVLRINEKDYTGVDFKIYYTIIDETKTIAIKVFCEGLLGMQDSKRQNIVAYMLELFIGELEFEARIGSVEIIDEPSDEENVCLLPNFYEDICDIIVEREWIEYHDPLSIYMVPELFTKYIKNAQYLIKQGFVHF